MDAHEVRAWRHVPLAKAENVNIGHAAGKATIAAENRWPIKINSAQSPALTFSSDFAIRPG